VEQGGRKAPKIRHRSRSAGPAGVVTCLYNVDAAHIEHFVASAVVADLVVTVIAMVFDAVDAADAGVSESESVSVSVSAGVDMGADVGADVGADASTARFAVVEHDLVAAVVA
jgi:hypothetical protein